ncbi:endo-beta-N-acetylglucosaminidase [Candidatus Mycoplasma mahonii]|uniref:endo-beta-N-acetylglucosaminidase n=1 Tax=Candidatus Mycoplasma mahonii TaxID=3004105 RepID=UPI0026EE455C|nr:hypothetical protein [Candidatus Mycoplasma mahonii]WKX02586.1 hypothetical protein O3I44_00710 [Candidatus Mycoplasma mahonii]
MKKIYYKLRGLGAIVIPVSTALFFGLSCSDNVNIENDSHIQDDDPSVQVDDPSVQDNDYSVQDDDSSVQDDVRISSSPRILTKDDMTRNFSNPTSTLVDGNNRGELQERFLSGQPFGLHYHARDLQQWDANNDIDRYYNRATVPLRDRRLAAKYISSQNPKDLDILASLNASTSRNKIGTVPKNYEKTRIFSMWQHISKMIGWGGSTSEGNWVIPKGDDINTAHRNGVPVIGTVFMAPNSFGGSTSQYEDMVVKDGDKFPVADSMVKMAEYYGFDGWFLNLETTGVSGELTRKIGDFIEYLYGKMREKQQFMILYDYGEGQKYFGAGNFDLAAIDFQFRDRTYDLPPEKRSYGYDYDRGVLTSTDQGGRYEYDGNNLWIYTYFKRNDPVLNGDEKDLKFFSDSEGSRDPRSRGTDAWTEMSKYFQDKTVINGRKTFTSSFEQGFGDKFYVKGVEQKLGKQLTNNGYRNAGLQDVFPTYNWINDYYNAEGVRISIPGDKINIDSDDWVSKIVNNDPTYYGSSSLKYTGKLEANHSMISTLYGSNIVLKENDNFSIIVKGSQTRPKIVIWTEDSDQDDLTFDQYIVDIAETTNLENDFFSLTYTIPANLATQTMKKFGLKFINDNEQIADANYLISKITFTPEEQLAEQSTPNIVTNLRHDGDFIFSGEKNIRINWDMTDSSKVDHYRIYSTKGDFTKDSLLTISALPAAFLQDIPSSTGSEVKIIIEAINEKNEVISATNSIVLTNFINMDDLSQMNDLSKWTATWERTSTDDSAKFITQTGYGQAGDQQASDGYNAKFKDTNGEIYFGDDYTRVHKLSNDGQFMSNGSYEWGKKLLGPIYSIDTHIRKIFNWDATHIAVVTQKGTLHILNKETGEATNDVNINVINKFLTTKNNLTFNIENLYREDENISWEIKNVYFANSKNGNTELVLSVNTKNRTNGTESTLPLLLNINQSDYAVSEETIADNVTIDKISITPSGSYIVAYKVEVNGEQRINIVKQDTLNLATLTNTSNISTKLEEFVNSVEFKNQIQSGGRVNADKVDFLTKGDIVDLREVNGKIMALNSWGLAFTIGLDGNIENITSIVDSSTWGTLADFFNNYEISYWFNENDPLHSKYSSFFDSTPLDNKLSTLYNIWNEQFNGRSGLPMSILGSILFDDANKLYISSQVVSFRSNWSGVWEFQCEIVTTNISTLLDGSNPKMINKVMSVALSNEDTKQVDSIRFMDSINEVYVVGGSFGKVALLDSNFEQIAYGIKVYSYDSEIVLRESRLFDDGHAIPKELRE